MEYFGACHKKTETVILEKQKKTRQTKKKEHKSNHKQLKLHQFYQPNRQFPSLSPLSYSKSQHEMKFELNQSTKKGIMTKEIMPDSMNDQIQFKSDEITLKEFRSFSPFDRNRIFPQKEVENRPNYKESSVTKKKKRKFSALDHDTPKSPSLIKKSLRKESFDNFSLYQSKDLLTTAIKKVKSEEVSPLNTLKVPMNILECEENFMETEPQKKDCQLATLEEFDSVMMDIPIDIKYLSSCQKNGEYLVNSNYFGTKQPEMTWNMRVILLDWMMEVCNDYMLKRQTYYMAVNYVDRFLSSYYNIPKNKLQLLGVVSLYVASKLEEIYPPKIQDFALVGHDYGPEEIKNFEETLLKTLKFRLNPCTITFWADWMMFQWDMVIEEKEGVPDSLLMNFSHDSLQFKQPNENSYKLFREFYQLLDCAMLDAKSLLYDTKLIVLSFLCLLLWGTVNKIGLKSVQQRFPEIFLEDQRGFHKLMQEFLKRANNCNLESLRTTIEFCSVFLGLDLEYDYPRATNIDRENVLEGHYADFVAYQTHNSNNLVFLKGIAPLRRPTK